MNLKAEVIKMLQANHGYGSMHDDYIADQIHQLYLDAFKEIIGEDEKIGDPYEGSSIPLQFTEVHCRNQLRAEQRQTLNNFNREAD